MKNDSFMLELFLREVRAQCAVLRGLPSGGDAAAGARAANSLKGAARMLGFSKYADVCEKLENFLNGGGRVFDSAYIHAVETLAKCADIPPEKLEQAVSEEESELDAVLNSDFSAPDSPSSPAPAASQTDALPPVDPSLKAIFMEEAANQLAVLSASLVELEDDFSNAKKLERLMRACHSLKGAARVVGLSDLVSFMHEMENCFSSAQNSKISINSDSLDVFLDCADFVGKLRENGFSRIDRSRYGELLSQLREIENGATPKRSVSTEPRVGVPEKSGGDAFVRVSAKSLSSLMELAAEILIENRRAEIFREAAASIKNSQEQIVGQLERAMNSLEGAKGSDAALARLEQLRKSLRALADESRAQTDALGEYSRRNVALSDRLYAEVLASRMRPLSDGLVAFPRLVRDLAKEAGKKIVLEIRGGDVPVDRDVLEKLEAPLTHLIRNACDHGIEPPEVREAAGKPRGGKITLGAWHSAGFLMIKITDDGAGLDTAKIRAKILEKRLAPPEILEKMPQDELFEFLFLPNFSTKDGITQLSGRGVGLDVVQSMLRDVGGGISVSTVAGGGSAFTMKLPITRSVIKALTVDIGGEPYAFALGRVYRTVKLSPREISAESGLNFFRMDGKSVRLFSGVETLGLGAASPKFSDEIYAVVVANKGSLFAFEVNSLPNEVELVVRPLNPRLGKIPCISAASLDENGLPVLIIDVDDLTAYAASSRSESGAAAEESGGESNLKKILVVDDSATVRETERKILAGAGYAVDTAVDGMDGWNSFRLSDYDLVVSDVDMPRMGGFELVGKIRKTDSSIPVVIVSYKDRAEDRARGAAAGANAYLTKNSFRDDSFLRTVKSLVDGADASV